MLKGRKNISGGKKHRRAGECQGAKKNEEKDYEWRIFIDVSILFKIFYTIILLFLFTLLYYRIS